MAKRKCKLIGGKFYMACGGHKHPAHIFAYDSKHKTYVSIKFGTTRGRHMIEIHPIQKNVAKSYVHSRPFEGTRNDYGDREMQGLSIDERDIAIIEIIKGRKPTQSKRAKLRYKNKKCR